jgi:Na+-driven multidrug efflux pump
MVGAWVIMLGGTFAAGELFDLGVAAVYAVLILSYLWMLILTSYWFFRGDWEARASLMIAERGSASSES